MGKFRYEVEDNLNELFENWFKKNVEINPRSGVNYLYNICCSEEKPQIFLDKTFKSIEEAKLFFLKRLKRLIEEDLI